MSDLRIILDDPEGLRVVPTGVYAGWTLGTVQWIDPYQNFVVVGGVLDPSAISGFEVHAVVQVTGPDGGSATLMTPIVYVEGSIQSVRVDLDSEGAAPAFAFSFASVEGMASSVEYQFRSSSYDARVVFADGRGVDYQFQDTDPSQIQSAQEVDLFGTFDWSERFSEFDEEGRLAFDIVVYDDETATQSQYVYQSDQLVQETHINRLGLRDDKYYEDGVITFHQRVDDATLDAYNFSSDLRTYSDGVISGRNMLLDDGVGISWNFSSGVLEYRAQVDSLDAHAYDNQVTFFDADGLARSGGRTMDDGRQVEFGYADGVRVHAATTDAEDAYTWFTKLDFYQTGGAFDLFAMHRNTTFDDGRHEYRRFEQNTDGESVIRQSVLSDLEDASIWTTRERSYDETGQIVQDVLKLDDGVVRTSLFTDGLRASSSMSDGEDARAFESIQRTYEEGDLQTVSIAMDDGRLIERQYVEGELSTVVSADEGDAFLWSDRLDTYHASELATRATLFDDGVMQNEQFDQSRRTSRERSDESDAHEWHSITEQFEDGIRVSRDVIWDDDLIA